MAPSHQKMSLLSLPPEILRRICKLLLNEHRKDLSQHLTICKTIFQVLCPLLWTVVALDHSEVLSFSIGGIHGGMCYGIIRTLTVNLKHLFRTSSRRRLEGNGCSEGRHYAEDFEPKDEYESSDYDSRCREMRQILSSLKALLLSRLNHLESFSLIIHTDSMDHYWCRECREEISATDLNTLIAALPPSCENLLVDTCGAETLQENPITDSIAKSLPNLRVLRMRVGEISKKLIAFANAPFDPIETSSVMKWRNSEHYPQKRLPQPTTVSGDWETQNIRGTCWGITTDILASWKWPMLSEFDQMSWRHAYARDFCPLPPVIVYNKLQEIVINFCLFPYVPSTELYEAVEFRSGLPGAALLAVNLRRAYVRGALPSLKTCRIISSDFELRNHEIELLGNYEEGFWDLPIGGISEIIVHNVVENLTLVMPFKCTKEWEDVGAWKVREQKIFEWRDKDDVPYLVSLADIERNLDIDNGASAILDPQSVMFPDSHTEIHDGILDRMDIREKRVDAGTADGHYSTWFDDYYEGGEKEERFRGLRHIFPSP